MTEDIFKPADILLPDKTPFETWSVIACDQFSSEREYWERVRETVGGAPSTLNMIIPEAYLDEIKGERETDSICAAMDEYIRCGLLREITDSFIYVERTLQDGRIRHGLIGTVDLEEYSFSGGKASILASEGTVLERLPARVGVRRVARLELPHIIAFIDDKEEVVIEPLTVIADKLPSLYDFDLMEGGGHIRGMQVCGRNADNVIAALGALGNDNKPFMVMGDGNHSLAAAKVYWDELKAGLGNLERESHPARRALVEINNVYDPAISIEAIHRVVFDTDPDGLLSALENALPEGADYTLQWISNGRNGTIGVRASCIGDMLAVMQNVLDEYVAVTGCRIDYIHGEDSARRLAEGERCLGILLPAMDKPELFATVAGGRVFPKKSFSVGHARDKRYYLECREIK